MPDHSTFAKDRHGLVVPSTRLDVTMRVTSAGPTLVFWEQLVRYILLPLLSFALVALGLEYLL